MGPVQSRFYFLIFMIIVASMAMVCLWYLFEKFDIIVSTISGPYHSIGPLDMYNLGGYSG